MKGGGGGGGGDHWWRWCRYWKFLSEWHLISLVRSKTLTYLKYPVIARHTSYYSALFHDCNPSIKGARIFITFFDLLILKTLIRFWSLWYIRHIGCILLHFLGTFQLIRFSSFWTTDIWNVNFVFLLETAIYIESPTFLIGNAPISPLSTVQIS